ncbi:hypothetical protein ABTE05_19210, partial [Acinetobacter baumannii]
GQGAAFARGAAVLVKRLIERNSQAVAQLDKEGDATGLVQLNAEEATLLLRYGQWQARAAAPELPQLMRLFELAALAGEVEARLELGLLCAKIDRAG